MQNAKKYGLQFLAGLGSLIVGLLYGGSFVARHVFGYIERNCGFGYRWLVHQAVHPDRQDKPVYLYPVSSLTRESRNFKVQLTVDLPPHVNSGLVHEFAAESFEQVENFVETTVNSATRGHEQLEDDDEELLPNDPAKTDLSHPQWHEPRTDLNQDQVRGDTKKLADVS